MPSALFDASIIHIPNWDFKIWKPQLEGMTAAHTHQDIEVNFLEAGRVHYILEGQFTDVSKGEVLVFWAGMPHQTLRKTPGTQGIWMTLPLVWLLRQPQTLELTQHLLAGKWLKFKASPLQQLQFASWLQDFELGDEKIRAVAVLEIEAAFARLSLQGKIGRPATTRGPVHQFEKITGYLAKHYTQDIQVEDVAKAVGLHPKYLLAFFRQSSRMTLWQYLLRLRLAHAQRLLLTTDRTVLDVAMEAGFGSLSAFYHAYKKCGGRPKELRSQVAGVKP